MLKRRLLINTLLLISAITQFIGAPFPVNAGSMIWSVVDTPSDSYFNVIVSPSEISALASGADGRTLYAVDTANLRLYRSADGGASWTDITNNLTAAGAALPARQSLFCSRGNQYRRFAAPCFRIDRRRSELVRYQLPRCRQHRSPFHFI